MDPAQVRDSLSGHVTLGLEVARNTLGRIRPGGTLIFMGDSGSRRVVPGTGIASAVSAVMPPFVAALALEIAPVRANVDRPRLRRQPVVGGGPWRPARGPPRGPAFNTPDRPGRRSRRHRRARRPPHDQHGDHRSDLRHRRRAAVRLLINEGSPAAVDSRSAAGWGPASDPVVRRLSGCGQSAPVPRVAQERGARPLGRASRRRRLWRRTPSDTTRDPQVIATFRPGGRFGDDMPEGDLPLSAGRCSAAAAPRRL